MAINYQSPPDPGEFTHPQEGAAEAERYESNQRAGKQTRNTGKEALLRGALRSDAVNSVHEMFKQHGMPLHDAQFGSVADEVVPWAESVTNRSEYNEIMGINPGDYVTQQNWRRGVGGSLIERHFSPRARAQGHLAGAAAMFAVSMPSVAGRPTVDPIRY